MKQHFKRSRSWLKISLFALVFGGVSLAYGCSSLQNTPQDAGSQVAMARSVDKSAGAQIKSPRPKQLTVAPEVAPIPKNNQPNRITSTIKGSPKTSRAFHWFTTDPTNGAAVYVSTRADMSNARAVRATSAPVASKYLPRDAKGFFIYKKINPAGKVVSYFTDEGQKNPRWEPWQEAKKGEKVTIDLIPVKETIYNAEIKGLQPNTVYYYQVGSRKEGLSPVGQFKTAGNINQPFTFLQYSDTQPAFWNEHKRNEAQFAAAILSEAVKAAPNAGFVLHTGDFVEVAEVEDGWVDLLGQSQPGLLRMTLVPVPGNHDEYTLQKGKLTPYQFNNHFNIANRGKIDGGSYYSFDYNNAHFVVLNTNDTKNPEHKTIGDAQMTWVRQDVKAARDRGAKWIIFTSHKPLFSKSYHSLEDREIQNAREEWMRLITDLKVDIALQGHDHVYSRTKPLRYVPKSLSFANAEIAPSTETIDAAGAPVIGSPKGTIFIVANTGGTKIYDAIFDLPLAHIHKVRPDLKNLTQADLEVYKKLFAAGGQPERSPRFATNHENYRDGSKQSYIVYHIDGNTLNAKVYEVTGDLSRGEKRETTLLDQFTIKK